MIDDAADEQVVLQPGAQVGRFAVVRALGAGGMGTVFEARDPELSRSVAVKLLHRNDGDALRLLREAQALARISHPNVVAVYELGSQGGRVFIAMELVDGVTLDRHLATPRPRREILAVFAAAGRGLAAVHAQGLVHRDVKPPNILVDGDGRVRIGDFGLARQDTDTTSSGPGDDTINLRSHPLAAADAVTVDAIATAHAAPTPGRDGDGLLASPLTATGAVMGTPRYMAPEQHAGQRVTRAADQFAFSVALWEALYGEHPFGDGVEIVDAVLAGRQRPAPPRSGVPAWLERTLVRGLATDPEARWPSMTALVDQLEQVPRRRRRVAIAAALTVAIAGVAGGAIFFARRDSAIACDRAAAPAETTWSPAARATIASGFAATRLAWASDAATRVDAALDAWITRWRDVRVDACRATHERGAESAAMLDQRAACLDGELSHVAILIAALAHPDPASIRNARTAIDRLPPPETCTAARLAGAAQVADDPRAAAVDRAIAEAAVALDLRSAEVAAITGQALAAARSLAEPGRLAHALWLHAQAIEGTAPATARAELDDAQAAAASAHDPVLEAQIVLRLIDRAETADRIDALLPVARAAVARAGSPTPLAHQLALAEYNAHAKLHRLDPARAACERAAGLVDAADAAFVRSGCACRLALGSYADVDATVTSCRDYATRVRAKFGDVHPKTADTDYNLANALHHAHRLPDAKALADRLLDVYAQLYGASSREVAATLRLHATIVDEQGNQAASRDDLRRALAIIEAVGGRDDVERGAILMELAEREVALGDSAAAISRVDDGLAVLAKRFGPDNPDLATVYMAHARVVGAAPAQHARALASWQHAAAQAEKAGRESALYGAAMSGWASDLMEHKQYADALPLAQAAVRAFEVTNNGWETSNNRDLLGAILFRIGRRDDAREALDRARAEAVKLGPAGADLLPQIDEHLRLLR